MAKRISLIDGQPIEYEVEDKVVIGGEEERYKKSKSDVQTTKPELHTSGLTMDQVSYHKSQLARLGDTDSLTTQPRSVRYTEPKEGKKNEALASKIVKYLGIEAKDALSDHKVYDDMVVVILNIPVIDRGKSVKALVKKVFYLKPPLGWDPPDFPTAK